MKVLSLVTLAIAVAAVFAMLDQDSGIAIWRELRGDLETSNERVEQLVRENAALRGEIAILESEPAALDRAIREELDLVLPGEVVVRFAPIAPTDPMPGSRPSAEDRAPTRAEQTERSERARDRFEGDRGTREAGEAS